MEVGVDKLLESFSEQPVRSTPATATVAATDFNRFHTALTIGKDGGKALIVGRLEAKYSPINRRELSMTDKTMLVAFDGSPESRRALEYAAQLLQPRKVEILTAWEPLHRQAARAMELSTLGVDPEDPAQSAALETCREGVELAQSLGLEARAHMVESATAIWSAIVDAADELRPDVIVTGTRGIAGWKSLWQSSTADSVLHHADVPVFVVPPLNETEEDETKE
ncbi:universal stress protein [Corynebacterium suranareeae]|uniref:Universal stress protein n=2 Tax=Corynebacterium suranareeae TaxID=2506452 RepID=A0A169S6I5_9CORY|nr:universal stress protein [Corynebacterium suranareeae]